MRVHVNSVPKTKALLIFESNMLINSDVFYVTTQTLSVCTGGFTASEKCFVKTNKALYGRKEVKKIQTGWKNKQIVSVTKTFIHAECHSTKAPVITSRYVGPLMLLFSARASLVIEM